jgi:hypothetical protein
MKSNYLRTVFRISISTFGAEENVTSERVRSLSAPKLPDVAG